MSDLKERRNIDMVLMAVLRTEMANRRTFLAWVKTAIGIGGVGIGLVKFSEVDSMHWGIGWVMVPLSLVIFLIGLVDYLRTRRIIEDEKNDAEV